MLDQGTAFTRNGAALLVAFYTILMGAAEPEEVAATEYPAEQSVSMSAVSEQNGDVQVIGGALADPLHWPATRQFLYRTVCSDGSEGCVGKCTSTIIGSRVMLTSANCIDGKHNREYLVENASSTEAGSTHDVAVNCEAHPNYRPGEVSWSNIWFDYALCSPKKGQLFSGFKFENISADASLGRRSCKTVTGESNADTINRCGAPLAYQVKIAGLGCTQQGKGDTGVLYTGVARITEGSSRLNNFIEASLGASACSGDSGSAAYMATQPISLELDNTGRERSLKVVGVVSSSYERLNEEFYISPTNTAIFVEFLSDWLKAKNSESSAANTFKVCGFDVLAENCRRS